MSNDWFQFQRFLIRQGQTAMKVGTDGVLLGSWTSGGGAILDIGTGTGLVALMLAQRFPDAVIIALEIDDGAAGQALENCAASPWNDRLKVICADFRDWNPPDGLRFTQITCNPPYFSRSLLNPDHQRASARHDENLPLEALIFKAAGLLTENGRFSLILPVGRTPEALDLAAGYGLHLLRRLDVRGHAETPVKRVLAEWGREAQPLDAGELVLETSRGVYSEPYQKLTSGFYLAKGG